MINKMALVVDDESDMLELLTVLLRRMGVAVMKAPSAERALHLVKSLKPDLFLLDVMMPGMDGFELCQHIRQTPHTAATPVIIVSALDTPRSRNKARECGANAFVPKNDLVIGLRMQVDELLSSVYQDFQQRPAR